MNIDYEAARNTLQEVFSDVQVAHVEGRGLQAPKGLGEPYDLLFESRTQAYREVLLGCILAKLVSVQADFAKLPADFINDGAGMPSR